MYESRTVDLIGVYVGIYHMLEYMTTRYTWLL